MRHYTGCRLGIPDIHSKTLLKNFLHAQFVNICSLFTLCSTPFPKCIMVLRTTLTIVRYRYLITVYLSQGLPIISRYNKMFFSFAQVCQPFNCWQGKLLLFSPRKTHIFNRPKSSTKMLDMFINYFFTSMFIISIWKKTLFWKAKLSSSCKESNQKNNGQYLCSDVCLDFHGMVR